MALTIRHIPFLLALLIFAFLFQCASSKNTIKPTEIKNVLNQKEGGWQKEEDKNNIQVYSRLHDGLSYKEYKVETIVQGTVINILALFVDYPAGCEWIEKCAEMNLVEEINLKKRIFYFEMSLPVPYSNRYALIDSYITLDKETKVLTIDMKMLDQVKENAPFRMKHYSARWILEPQANNKTKVTFQSFIDFGGNAPVWLANYLGGGALHDTFENMSERLKYPKYVSSESTRKTQAIYNCVLSGLCKDTLVR